MPDNGGQAAQILGLMARTSDHKPKYVGAIAYPDPFIVIRVVLVIAG